MLSMLLKKITDKIDHASGPGGVIDTQISMYKKLKHKFPNEKEDNVLNCLITSRINAPFGQKNKTVELNYYKPLIKNSDKTLEEVIWWIVKYEFYIEVEGKFYREWERIDSYTKGTEEEHEDWKAYIKNVIGRVKTSH